VGHESIADIRVGWTSGVKRSDAPEPFESCVAKEHAMIIALALGLAVSIT